MCDSTSSFSSKTVDSPKLSATPHVHCFSMHRQCYRFRGKSEARNKILIHKTSERIHKTQRRFFIRGARVFLMYYINHQTYTHSRQPYVLQCDILSPLRYSLLSLYLAHSHMEPAREHCK